MKEIYVILLMNREVRYRSPLGDSKEPMLHSAKSTQNLDSAKSTRK